MKKKNSAITDDASNETRTKRLTYKIREVSNMTGVSQSTLRKMVRRGDLNVITSFGPWLIPQSEIDRLMSKTIR